jgi:phosphocarrier protein HPr
MTRRHVTISNQLGLHARAAARFVHLAGTFDSHVRVSVGIRTIDGKSILGLLLLAASPGSAVLIEADGPDEDAAVAALGALVERGFEDEGVCAS